VHARLERQEPFGDAEEYEGGHPRDTGCSQGDDGADRGEGQPEGRDIEVACVEDGDDDDGSQVVDDGEGQEEEFQRRGNSRPQEGEHADGEGDVGGHRDPQPRAPGPPALTTV
jgi:hypothetical protein